MASLGCSCCRGFNPRSREGSDVPVSPRALASARFNPRSREGSDVHCIYMHSLQSVSIHAPVKGATIINISDFSIFNPFQSTLP